MPRAAPATGNDLIVATGPPANRRPPSVLARWLPWLLGAGMVVAVIVVALRSSEAGQFVRLTERAEPWWLAVALALQGGTYWAQAEVFRVVARAARCRLPLAPVYKLGLAKIFVDQALPSAGISGTFVLARGLEALGLKRAAVAAAVSIDLASYYAAYIVSLAGALVYAAIHREASEFVVLVSIVFGIFAIAIGLAVVALSGRGARRLPFGLSRLRSVRVTLEFLQDAEPRYVRSPRLLLLTSALQLVIVVLDAATVWVLIRSLGERSAALGVFASFVISSLFRTIGILPGGLGTFEASSVLTLKLVGVAVPVALSATLLFRGLSFWLPLVPGLWYSRHAVVPGAAPGR